MMIDRRKTEAEYQELVKKHNAAWKTGGDGVSDEEGLAHTRGRIDGLQFALQYLLVLGHMTPREIREILKKEADDLQKKWGIE